MWSLFVCCPSVRLCLCLSIYIFKRLLIWSHWTNFAQNSYGASLGWRNERLLKWSQSVDQDGPMPLYGKNLEKSSSPEPRMPWGWIFAQIIGGRRSTKVAKIMVVQWHLTFLQRGQVCFPMQNGSALLKKMVTRAKSRIATLGNS